MGASKHAVVSVVVHLPYDEHDEEQKLNIELEARRIREDPAFLAVWYGVGAEQLRDNEDCYVEAHVDFGSP